MKPFSAPLNDILFTVEHVVNANTLSSWDANLAAEIAQHFATFAQNEIAPLDEPGDRQGCSLINGRVYMPDGFKAVYDEFVEQGWPALSAPEEYGGQQAGPVVAGITSEIFSGACHSLQMVVGLVPAAIRTLMRFGTDNQKSTFIPPLVSGNCIATMCLTEPNAGSDLSRIRCKAEQIGQTWKITGEKIYISGGDQNLSEDILHIVLARTSDDGIRGLSLFLCPSKTASERNKITVSRIENKMGLHASPTCQLVFDEADAQLIGSSGEGLRAMFTMMNHARLDVALQGVAHAARAYDVAFGYASERKQGRLENGSSAMLIQHADVARMIDEIDAIAMGGRAISYLALKALQDGTNPDLIEFLTPVAKVYCTEGGIRAASLGMQVLGGYGYLSEYRLEQTYRDARICAIYEGANGVHERALSERLLQGAHAKTADAFESYLVAQANELESDELTESIRHWRNARNLVAESTLPSALAHDFMRITIDTLLHSIWLRFNKVANKHNDPSRIKRLAKVQIIKTRAYLPATLSMIQSKSE